MTEGIRPGAEPFRFDAGPVGALFLHGFSGSPAALRPFGAWLAERGVSSVGPLLPGHGRSDWRTLARASWRDWADEASRALDGLRPRCSTVVAIGLSMGGALALHLGATRPEALAGVVTVNPWVRDPRILAAPVLRYALRSVKGVGNDIRRAGQDEVAYERIALPGLATMVAFQRVVRAELSSVRLPLLVFRSTEDHTIPGGSAELVMARVGSARKELVALPRSYHVATLDDDAEAIFERTLSFARDLAPST